MPPTEEHAEFSTQLAKTNLLHLSPELLLDIVAMLPRLDLKSLRLTNRVLCGIASSNMFESISLRDDPRSLGQLKQIANSRIWASQVRHIEWALCKFEYELEGCWPPNPVFSASGDILPYLIVQCEYLQRLPSIKAVQDLLRFTTAFPPDKAPNLYVLIRAAKLQPLVIRAHALSLKLGYGPSGCIQQLSISESIPQDNDVINSQGGHSYPAYVQCHHSWRESWTAINPLVFRAITLQENHFAPTRCDLKNFILHQHDFWRRLFGSSSLRSMKIENVLLMSCENKAEDPLEAIMGIIKDRAPDATIPALKVTIINITKEKYEGMVSINDDEINRWINDQDSDWLETKQAAFTPSSEYSDVDGYSDDMLYIGF